MQLLRLIAVLTLGTVLVGFWNSGESSMVQTGKCSVEVWLNRKVEHVSGLTWPNNARGEPRRVTMVEQPCECVLHLPSGRMLRLPSKNTTLQQRGGYVKLVAVLPLQELVDFSTAVNVAEHLVREYKLGNARTFERIDGWRAAPPNDDPFGPGYLANIPIEDGVELALELRAHDSNGWFVALDFQGEEPRSAR
jgi:hypothetical protein